MRIYPFPVEFIHRRGLVWCCLFAFKNFNFERCVLQDDPDSSGGDNLLADLEDALLNQRQNCTSGVGLIESGEKRYQSHIQHRLAQLEGH